MSETVTYVRYLTWYRNGEVWWSRFVRESEVARVKAGWESRGPWVVCG